MTPLQMYLLRSGGGAAGDARMSYRDYTNPYSAPMPGYMDAVRMAMPFGSLPTVANYLSPTQGREYAVYGGGPLGEPPISASLPGMTRAEVDALRKKHDQAREDAAAGYSTNEPGISMSESTRQRNLARYGSPGKGHPSRGHGGRGSAFGGQRGRGAWA